MNRSFHSQSAFSLVELMVAVLLSVFIVGVSFSLLVSASKTFAEHQSEAAVQENSVYAFDMLRSAVRRTWSAANDSVSRMNGLYGKTLCKADANAGAASSGTSACSVSDLSRFGDRLALEHGSADTRLCGGLSESVAATYLATLYWAADIDQDGIASLYCQTLDIESGDFLSGAAPVVDGIERLKFELGSDLNGDEIIDVYTSVNNALSRIGDSNAAQAKSVRIRLLVSNGLAPSGDNDVRRVFSTTEAIRSASL